MSATAAVVRVFIRLLSKWALSGALERQRKFAQAGRGLMLLPRGTAIREERVGDIRLRWFTPAHACGERLVYFIHGGGWVFGLIPYYDVLLSWIARAACSRVAALDYRLAPEYPFPAALEDCLFVYRWLLARGHDPARMAVMGDSAGGNLALAAMLAARDEGLPLPAAGVCLSPATDLASRGESYRANRRREALLPDHFVDFARQAYLDGKDARNPLISPLYADLRGLPPLLIQVGGDEILLSDAEKFAVAARQAGVDARLHVYPGMWHVWQTAVPYLPEARKAIHEIGLFVRGTTR